ncbi:hypothetical protein [Halalkalicoccus ordinarius]|uniref:hypothetical protein n=1 Tax=Halalkalicoccus ordinarius TaxID=3116651 RepID=UPI00300EA260
MLWKAIELLVGSEWRAFCGLGPDRFLALAIGVLDELGYQHTVEEISTTEGERTMLGADETGDRIIVSDPASFQIEVIRARINPITSVALSFVLTEERREELTDDLSVVTLREIDDTTRDAMAAFMNRVIAESDRPPWNVSHHIGFQLAVLLRYKIKILWGYWRRL